MDISQVPTNVLQQIASQGQSSQQNSSGNSDLSQVPTDVLQQIAGGQNNQTQMNPEDSLKLLQPASMDSGDFNGSPLSLLKRMSLSRLSPDEQITELKKSYKYVEPLADGRISVGNTSQDMRPISSDNLLTDSLGHLADHMDMAANVVGMGLGSAFLGGAPIEAALAGTALKSALAKRALGQIVGSGLGAGIGQAGMEGLTPPKNSQEFNEAAGRVAMQTMFGSATDGLLKGFGLVGSKVVSPQLAKIWGATTQAPTADQLKNNLAEYIAMGQNPSRGVQFQQQMLKTTAGLEPQNVHAVATFGPEEVFNNPVNNDPNHINVLAANLIKSAKDQDTLLGRQLDASAQKFAASTMNQTNPELKVNLNPAYQQYLQNLEKDRFGQIVYQNAPDGTQQIAGFNFARNPAIDLTEINKHKQLLEALGGREQRGAYEMPVQSNQDTIKTTQGNLNRENLKDMIQALKTAPGYKAGSEFGKLGIAQQDAVNFLKGTQKITRGSFVLPSQLDKMSVQDALNLNKDFSPYKSSPQIGRFFKSAPEDVNRGFQPVSMYDEFGRIADTVGNDEAKAYLAKRAELTSFKSTIEKMAQLGMDLRVPIGEQAAGTIDRAAKFLGKSTTVDINQARALDELQGKIGTNFLQPSLEWAANRAIQNTHPNFFRFGMLMNFITSPFNLGSIRPLTFLGGLATSFPKGIRGIMSAGVKAKAIQSKIAEANARNPLALDMAKKALVYNLLKASSRPSSPR